VRFRRSRPQGYDDARPPSRPSRRPILAATAVVLALALAGAGCDSGNDPTPPTPTPSVPPSTTLTFGVYGPEDEITAIRAVVENFNSLSDGPRVQLRSWSDHDRMVADLRDGTRLPDIFMASRSDLAWIQAEQLNQPVDTLLDERGLDFGDGYSRIAQQAFSADNRLQCMPYGISPMVVFYNTELVNFDRMRRRGLDAPDLSTGDNRWSFEQFAAAADFASRPGRTTRGVQVEPTLPGLAPFIFSGGGSLFDDGDAPTSLTFSDDATRGALERALEVLRDPHLTLSEKQLAEASPETWFKRGKLAMIEGYRSLVPELRTVQGLEFDVMPMPSLDGQATVGDITGLCLARDNADTAQAADFLVHAVSSPMVSRVTRTGYLAPANLEVALSDDFLQAGRAPAHAEVFNTAVRAINLFPLLDSLPELEASVAPLLRELVSVPVLDLDAMTTQIDERSRTVLSPESPSPSSG
jgi:multiple sugar transport system substrate-binding protein